MTSASMAHDRLHYVQSEHIQRLRQHGRWTQRGFNLIELLVVIAIIAVLASLLLATLSSAKRKAQGIQCMNHHRQLALAWRMYAEDNNDRILHSTWSPVLPGEPTAWVFGVMDFSADNESNWNEETIKKSLIWPYCGYSTAIFKCPADKSTVQPASGPFKGTVVPRLRSMSMNYWLGGVNGSNYWRVSGSGWRVYLSLGEMVDPGPTRTFVFLDMREDSIDQGNFATDMTGWPDNPAALRFLDLPGAYHNRAGGFSFADGHSEIKRWLDDRTVPPLKKRGFTPDRYQSPYNKDIIWLQERATRKLTPLTPSD